MVGDDAQSIYSFRGANFRNIMDFPEAFPETRIIKLEENYRSTQPILNLTNEIIAARQGALREAAVHAISDGARPQSWSKQRASRCSPSFVCQKILELREQGVPLWDIAVLFRSSFHSFDLEIELARHNIPFVKRGGFQFMETTHVKDLLAHLRILANPQDCDFVEPGPAAFGGRRAAMSQKITRWLLDGSHPVERLRTFQAKGKIAQALKTLAQVLRIRNGSRAAAGADAIPDAILCADSEAEPPRRSSEAACKTWSIFRASPSAIAAWSDCSATWLWNRPTIALPGCWPWTRMRGR